MKKIISSISVIMTATLVVSGFFIFSSVLAATHTTTVSVEPEYVAGGSTDIYTFTVTNNGPDAIYEIIITADTGFIVDDDPTCPSGWLPSHTGTSIQCLTDAFGGDVLNSGDNVQLSFFITAPTPGNDTSYDWTVLTKDSNAGYEFTNTEAKTTVDVTAPITTDNAPEGWQGNNVDVSLTPSDGEIGSGIAATYSCVYSSGDAACDPVAEGTSVDVTCAADSVCQKIVRYYSVDSLENTEAEKDSGVIQIDKQAPTTEISVGTPKHISGEITYVTSDSTFTLTSNDGDGSGAISTEYKIDEGEWTVYEPFTVAEVGEHTIYYRSVDEVENVENDNILTIYVDNENPVVTEINIIPIYNDGEINYISGISDISATVIDAGSGIKQCWYTLNGGTDWTGSGITYNLESDTCSVSGVDTSEVTVINIKAEDNVGNSDIGTTIAVIPDTQSPTASVNNAPVNWQNTDVLAEISCDDSGSGCNALTISYKLYDSDPGTCPVDSSEYTLGTSVNISSHQWVCAYAEDNVGNAGVSNPIEFQVDKTVPTITDDYADGWQNSPQTIILDPGDTGGSEISEVKYCEEAECDPDSGTLLGHPYQLTYNSEGVTTVLYQTWDNADNSSDMGSFTVRIDTSDPTAEVTGAPKAWTNVTQTASITCSDQEGLSGCDETSFKYKVYTSDSGSCSTNAGEYTLDTSANITEHSWVCSYVKDNAGNEDFSDSPVEFTVDKTVPSGGLTDTPVDWQNTDATIGLTSGDTGGSGVANSYLNAVPYNQDCNAITEYASPITISEHSTTCWKVVDGAGNEISGSEEIKIDKTNPSVNAGEDKISKEQITQDATVSDADSGVATYLWGKVSGPGNITFGSADVEDTTISVDADGAYVIRLTATDNAGNSANNTMQLTWDTVDPTVVITSPEDTVYKFDNVDLIFTPTDPDPGTALTCSYKVDSGADVPVVCESGMEVNTTVTDLLDGRRIITLTVTDAAGNFVSDSVSFVIDLDNILTVGATDADFATIQAAIDVASGNDTIAVSVGTYTEDLSISTEGINLAGADKTTTIIKGVSNVAIGEWPLAVPNIDVRADGVAIHGFTIEGPDYEAGKYSSGIVIEGTNVEIYGNDFKIAAGANTDEISQTIQTYHKNAVPGVDVSGLNVHDNTFTSLVTGDGGYEGIYVNLDEGIGSITIQNNQFSGDLVRAITVERSSAQIISNTVITDLTPGLPGGYLGIYIGSTGGTQTAITVTENTVKGSASGKGFLQGIRIGSSSQTDLSGISVTGNTVEGNDNGIYVKNNADGVVVNSNTIISNTVGVQNDDTANSLNAIQNYWGTAVAATIASNISGSVDYEPYYVDSGMTILSNVAVDTVYVDDNYLDGLGNDGHYFGYDAFATIQEGIDAVADNGTTTVAAGSYTESLMINKSLTLQGAGRIAVTIIGTHTITANDVIIDGFTLDANGVNFAVITIDDTSGIISGGTISDNKIFNSNLDGIRIGMSGSGNGVNHIIIEDNEITANNRKGILFYNGGDYEAQAISDITISGNEITFSGSSGISTYGPGLNTITGNTVTNNTGNGISIKYDNGDTISGNTVTGNGAMGINMHQVTNTLVENNIVSGHVSDEVVTTFWGGSIVAGKGSAIYVHEVSQNNIIRLNDLTGNKIGVLINREPGSDGEPSSNSINNNKITGNTEYGILNALVGPSTPVDAARNWWGVAVPDFNTTISGDVTYDPWYLDEEMVTLSSDVGRENIYIDDDYTENLTDDGLYFGFNAFTTIQEGINAVEGSTVYVAAGTYNEDIIIDKSLTLNGVQVGVDARGRSEDESEIVGVVVVTSDATNVVFDGFKFISPTRAFNPRGFNLHIESESSTIRNNIFVAEENEGHTWSAYLDFLGITNAVVEFNDFSGDYDAIQSPNVILFNGASGTVTVENNEMHDVGGGGGIGIMPGAGATINIEDNVIDHTGDGIWLWGTEDITLSIQGNSIYNNDGVHGAHDENIDTGVKLAGYGVGSNIAVNYNNIYDNNLGMANTGSLTIDAKSNWWGTTTGPNHSTNMGGLGDVVSDNVDFRPWCTEDTCTVLDSAAPEITSHSPSANAVGVNPSINITVVFTENVQCGAGDWLDCISLSPGATGNASYDSGTYTLTFDPDSDLLSNTDYTVTLSNVIDLVGNYLSGDMSWLFTIATHYSISLSEGWNLISIPTVPTEDTSIDIVLGESKSKIDSVWMYDAVEDKWYVYHTDGSPSDLDTMTAGYGYWISATGDAIIEGYGSLFTEAQTPPQRQLAGGWNLIGYYQNSGDESVLTNYAFATLTDSYRDISTKWWTSLVGYNNIGKSFKSISWDSMVDPVEAFWIFMKSSTITYMYGPGEKYSQ